MQIVECNESEHAQAILGIINHAIENTTALYEYTRRSEESMEDWFANKRSHEYPILGLVNAEGVLMGFSTYGPFRYYEAYQYTVEHSVYVKEGHHGKGLGSKLLKAVIDAAYHQGYHTMIGCIDADNKASIRLHAKYDFQHVGTLKEVGYKFNRWLDAVLYQRTLPGQDER